MSSSPVSKWKSFLIAIAVLTLADSLAMAQQTNSALGQGPSSASSTKNLLVNGAFENGVEGWTFSSVKNIGQMSIDEIEKHENKPSVRIDNGAGDDSQFKQKVTVEAQTRYRLEGYIKTKGLRSLRREGKGSAHLCLFGTWQRSKLMNGTKLWTKVSVDIVTGVETEVEVGGGCFEGPDVGAAWFAELSLVKIGKAPLGH